MRRVHVHPPHSWAHPASKIPSYGYLIPFKRDLLKRRHLYFLKNHESLTGACVGASAACTCICRLRLHECGAFTGASGGFTGEAAVCAKLHTPNARASAACRRIRRIHPNTLVNSAIIGVLVMFDCFSTTIAKSRLQKFTERRCIPEVMTAIESFYNSVALRSECIMPGMMHGADF